MTLQELIEELGGNQVQGDPEWMVDGVNSCEKAGAFDVAFADSDSAVAAALGSNAGVVVLKPGGAKEYPHGKCIVESDDPKLWFAKAAKILKKRSLSRRHRPFGGGGARCKGGSGSCGGSLCGDRVARQDRRWDSSSEPEQLLART